MRAVKWFYLVIGVAVLVLIVAETDLAEVARRVVQIGWGMAIVLALYSVTFTIDSFIWLVTLGTRPLSLGWLFRMGQVRLVGEAFNMTVPAGGVGGEPVKAVMLRQRYGIGYGEGTASLFLVKTVNMIGLAVFLAAGLVLMLGHGALPGIYVFAAALGLAGVAAGTLIFFSIQRFGFSSRAARWLSRWRVARRLADGLEKISEVESLFVGFYSGRRGRFAATVALGFLGWAVGALEIYTALAFLGHPVSIVDAWIIEAMAQMVRAGSFFIPASIGMQDGAFVLMCTAITGSPELGVAVALVRRVREITWIAAGLALGSMLHLSRP